jgi:hypothetical protein
MYVLRARKVAENDREESGRWMTGVAQLAAEPYPINIRTQLLISISLKIKSSLSST